MKTIAQQLNLTSDPIPTITCSQYPYRAGKSATAAFTFIELLIVLGAVAVLALLSITALAHSQPSSDRAGCANNLRRLMQGWQMYADDNSGQLVGNYRDQGGTLSAPRTWVRGSMDYEGSNADNTNTVLLTNSAYALIGPYVNRAALFRCPADPTTLLLGGRVIGLRVRSYSMNEYIGPIEGVTSPSYQSMTKTTEISQPNINFVLLEEHPRSISGGVFSSDLASVGLAAKLVRFPGYFHLGGANLGMADGHVEYWQWSDDRTMPPMNTLINFNITMPNNPDIARLQAAASYPR